jgi:poly(U)-specific endoribonuclease
MADIYEQILNLPASWLAVARPVEGGWSDPAAPIRLQEQDRGGSLQPLFAAVDEAIFARPSVAALAALFNNYDPFEGRPDVQLSDPQHSAEIEALLDAIMDTEPMQLAVAYLRDAAPGEFPDAGAVRAWTRQVWFEPFVNEFANPERDCAGFEHVFVGEVQNNAHPGDNVMDIGGYHSWIKYAHDQRAGLVSYRGHDYTPGAAAAGKANPREASVIMTWTVNNTEYLKNPGGFFVADLPEMQFALGIVGLFDSLRGTFGGTGASGKKTDRRVPFGDDSIDLVVYPQTVRSGGATKVGPHLRSMYPKFRGAGAPTGGGGGGGGGQPPHTPHNNGPIRVLRALPNPEGTDETGEWVELKNITQHEIPLDGWTLRDAQNRARPLSGTLGPDATTRVELTRDGASAMQLGNSGGWILLFQGTERIAAVPYGQAQNNQVINFG